MIQNPDENRYKEERKDVKKKYTSKVSASCPNSQYILPIHSSQPGLSHQAVRSHNRMMVVKRLGHTIEVRCGGQHHEDVKDLVRASPNVKRARMIPLRPAHLLKNRRLAGRGAWGGGGETETTGWQPTKSLLMRWMEMR